MINDAAHWIALAHIPKWGYLKINNLIIKFYHDQKKSIEEFFQLPETDWKEIYGLDVRDINDLKQAKSELTNNAFLAETMQNEGYEIIPIISPEYPRTMKENLKAAHAPSAIYVKGNKQILTEKSLAIVGSRSASDISLQFTDNIARMASRDYKVVVSGFAKGVDKQALDSAIKYKGQSIIVLPQGIMTFGSGFKTYYRQIVDGDVLVLSTFFPKAPWRVELAMARNPIIYGLASEIYVAESADKGGTWSGVADGLRKNRVIFVRKPGDDEKNANKQLIEKGAIPVDFDGTPVATAINSKREAAPELFTEPEVNYEQPILELLKKGNFTIKEIKTRLKIEWSDDKLRKYLRAQKEVEEIKKSPLQFTHIGRRKQQEYGQKMLFD
jgi:predicted Rossmann fold nucleotide-binding protein DprA/Smf involved in DNA uptake